LIRPLLVSWGLLLAMEWPAYRITRSREWSSILLLIVVLGFFSRFDFASAMFFGTLAMAALLWIVFRLLRRELKLFHMAMALHALSLAVILWCGSWWYQHSRAIPSSYYERRPG
jgi:hypothetical protein